MQAITVSTFTEAVRRLRVTAEIDAIHAGSVTVVSEELRAEIVRRGGSVPGPAKNASSIHGVPMVENDELPEREAWLVLDGFLVASFQFDDEGKVSPLSGTTDTLKMAFEALK